MMNAKSLVLIFGILTHLALIGAQEQTTLINTPLTNNSSNASTSSVTTPSSTASTPITSTPTTPAVSISAGIGPTTITIRIPSDDVPVSNCNECPRGLQCCNNAYCINSTISLCCDGRAARKPSPNAWCCGSTAYNPDTQQCCNKNVVHKSPPPAATFCCGNFSQNPDVQICCDNQVNEKCGRTSWCCAKSCYNPDAQLCCDNTAVNKCSNKTSWCCGKSCYDPDKQMCCDKTVVNKCGQPSACCGKQCYNLSKQRCVLIPQIQDIQ